MENIKIKTTTGKTFQVNRKELEAAAVKLFDTTFAQSHNVIIWGDKTTSEWAIVPYNKKLHSNEK